MSTQRMNQWTPPRDPHDESPAAGGGSGFDWGERTDRTPRRGAAPAAGTAGTQHRNPAPGSRAAGTPERNAAARPERHPDPGAERNVGTREETPGERNGDDAGERNGDDAGERNARSDAGGPVRHEIVVPVHGAADTAVATRVGDAAQERAAGLRFVNLPLGSLHQILRYAAHADYNLAHIPIVRAANIAFFGVVTVPLLTIARCVEWVHLRLHRAAAFWVVLLVCAHFGNRLVDWAVPDWLDAGTWSTTTWQWVAGGALVFILTTVGVHLRRRRR